MVEVGVKKGTPSACHIPYQKYNIKITIYQRWHYALYMYSFTEFLQQLCETGINSSLSFLKTRKLRFRPISSRSISSSKIGGVGWGIVIAAGVQIRNDRVKQMRGKNSLLHWNLINTPLDFFLHLLWGPHGTVVGGYSSLHGIFSRRRFWCWAATLKDTCTQTPSHVSIFSRHPCWKCWLVISWDRKCTPSTGSLARRFY